MSFGFLLLGQPGVQFGLFVLQSFCKFSLLPVESQTYESESVFEQLSLDLVV